MQHGARILIITQKVDAADSYFGFFPEWIAAFARSCERVTVVALERRAYEFPENVTVLSLGKERSSSRLAYLWRFWKYVYAYRNDYDAVFCHMSPLYVIAGFPLWKLLRKRIGLWYVHRHVDFKLRIAEKLADVVFTASPESFRLPSTKLHFMRQAVPVALFRSPAPKAAKAPGSALRLVSVGRITRIKHLPVLIRAAKKVLDAGQPVEIELIGAPITAADEAHARELKALVRSLALEGVVTFTGSQPFTSVREAYWRADASVNLAPTGGMDKAVLESLAAGTPAFVANNAFAPLLAGYEEQFLVPEGNADVLSEKLRAFALNPAKEEVTQALRKRVVSEYSLDALIPQVVALLTEQSL